VSLDIQTSGVPSFSLYRRWKGRNAWKIHLYTARGHLALPSKRANGKRLVLHKYAKRRRRKKWVVPGDWRLVASVKKRNGCGANKRVNNGERSEKLANHASKQIKSNSILMSFCNTNFYPGKKKNRVTRKNRGPLLSRSSRRSLRKPVNLTDTEPSLQPMILHRTLVLRQMNGNLTAKYVINED